MEPARSAVNLGAVCRQLDVKPVEVTCPLDRLTGTFAWPEPGAPPAEVIAITVQVETWNAVPLSGGELNDLRRFLRGLQSRQ